MTIRRIFRTIITCMHGIYKITNTTNSKTYIGQSNDIERRFKHHKGMYTDFAITRAFKRYGIDNFTFEVLYECPIEEMNKWETFYITIFGTLAPNGYNLNMGGDGKEISEETRAKMSESRKKQIRPKCKEETKQKIGNANRGKKHTEETKQKWSNQRKGKKLGEDNPMFGKTGAKNTSSKAIEIDGVIYGGVREAARLLNMTYDTLRWRLNSENYSNYFYL